MKEMKDIILEKYNDLYEDIQMHYNQIEIKDGYDNTTYTYLYLNKNDSFDKLLDHWEKHLEKLCESNYSYDEKIDMFVEKEKENFDLFRLYIDIYTCKSYDLII